MPPADEALAAISRDALYCCKYESANKNKKSLASTATYQAGAYARTLELLRPLMQKLG
jgi:hypothetical protein